MPVEMSARSAEHENARQALAEIRACRIELQAYIDDLFDQGRRWAGEEWMHELDRQQTQWRTDQESLHRQIEQLTILVSKLAEVLR
jgi:hypothetical protein